MSAFWGFWGLVVIGTAIMTWPESMLKWTGRIVGGLAIYATIVLWAVILDPRPTRVTPPIGVVMLMDSGDHER